MVGMTPTAARLPWRCAREPRCSSSATAASRSALRPAVICRDKLAFFVCVELGTLLMNYFLFRWLVPKVHGVPPELVSFLGTFIVFVTFAYPMRRLVIFKLPT